MEVAQTILEQLGGNRFLVMTGAKNLVGGPAHLQFKLPRGAKDGITNVRVELMSNDTYAVQFWKIRGVDMRLVSRVQDVYADDLRDVFTSHTGLETSLGTMGVR